MKLEKKIEMISRFRLLVMTCNLHIQCVNKLFPCMRKKKQIKRSRKCIFCKSSFFFYLVSACIYWTAKKVTSEFRCYREKPREKMKVFLCDFCYRESLWETDEPPPKQMI